MIEDEKPDQDKFALLDTRPNMIAFVPYELAMIFGIGFFAINNETHSLKNGLIILPFWILAAILVRRDVNGVRVFFTRMRVCTLMLDQHRWGGLSISPWPLKAW